MAGDAAAAVGIEPRVGGLSVVHHLSVAWIALGSNLGQPDQHVRQAFASLADIPGVQLLARSNLYRSAPVGGPPGQADFCNAAAAVATMLSPFELLTAQNAIEAEHGRERVQRNGPRTLDLDIISFDSLRMTTQRLTLPHPRAARRAFVLLPLAEISPALSLGRAGRVIDLCRELDARDMEHW